MKYIIGIIFTIIFWCCEKPQKTNNNILLTNNFNSKLNINEYLDEYINFSKSREDTIKVIVLNVESDSDSTIIYISSTKSSSFLKDNYPTLFTFHKGLLIVIYCGVELVLEKNNFEIEEYERIINEYSYKHHVEEFSLHNPINWAVSIQNNRTQLHKTLSEELIFRKIYHLKQGVRPKIKFN